MILQLILFLKNTWNGYDFNINTTCSSRAYRENISILLSDLVFTDFCGHLFFLSLFSFKNKNNFQFPSVFFPCMTMIEWYCLEQKYTDSIWIWAILTWHDWRHAMANQVHLKKRGKLIHKNDSEQTDGCIYLNLFKSTQSVTQHPQSSAGECYKKNSRCHRAICLEASCLFKLLAILNQWTWKMPSCCLLCYQHLDVILLLSACFNSIPPSPPPPPSPVLQKYAFSLVVIWLKLTFWRYKWMDLYPRQFCQASTNDYQCAKKKKSHWSFLQTLYTIFTNL